MGHEVRCVGVLDSLTELRTAIADWKPDIAFNLLEEFDGIVTYDQHVVAFLELMRQPYTGCNPRGLLLSRDKALSKQLLAFHRIPTPQFAVFRKGTQVPPAAQAAFPLFVKSTVEDASLGIAQASVVEDAAKLKERVEFVHEQVGSDALVEEFIEGRELYVGVLGNERLTRLPVWEMVFGSHAGFACRHRHAQGEVGQAIPDASTASRRARRTSCRPPCVARLDKLSRRIYRALGLSGCARMDFRVTADGQVLRARGECQPEPRSRRRFRRVGACCRRGVRRSARRAHGARHVVPGGMARLLWLSRCACMAVAAARGIAL